MTEFALVAPVLIVCILGAWQLSYIGWAQNRLENAVREASRVGITGKVSGNLTRLQVIENTVTAHMASVALSDSDTIHISPQYFPTFGSMVTPGEPFDDADNNGVCDTGETYYDYDGNGAYTTTSIARIGSGGPGDIVKYSVAFPLRLFVPLAGRFFGSNGTLTLTANTVVRNEFFGAPASPPAGACP